MGFPVYDNRRDVRNVLVTPQIRSRFLRMEPGQESGAHTHDLGHEVFLVLQGRALFHIDGESEELGPGEMCVALAGQMHSLQVVSEGPMTMYLSVTPHIQPTHTMWDREGMRLPHRFTPSSAYDTPEATGLLFAEQVDQFVEATRALAEAAGDAASGQGALSARLKGAVARGDVASARSARDALWDALFPVYERAYELAALWNALAPRADGA